MGRRTIAPRLRLLGLLLICASIIMGLLLSAIGVQSVTLSSSFAQEIAGQIQNVSNTRSANLNSNQLENGTHRTSMLPVGMQNTAPTTGYQSGLDHTPTPHDKQPFTISLWALVAPICLVGILLWMTPMPAASTGTNRSYKRR